MNLMNFHCKRIVTIQNHEPNILRKGIEALHGTVIPYSVVLVPSQPDLNSANFDHLIICGWYTN